jgi:hypothetical protein
MLERGFDSRTLRVLAGITPPLNHFEIAELRDRALDEASPAEIAVADPVTSFVRELVADALAGRKALGPVFCEISQLAIELGYPRELQAFYNLRFAWEDLQISDVQWYWVGATRENIEQLMRDEAERFARGVPAN